MKDTDLRSNVTGTDFPIILQSPALKFVEPFFEAIIQSEKGHFKYLSWAQQPITKDSVYGNMENAIINFQSDTNEYRFMITDSKSNEFLGCIGLFIRNIQIPFYEIGYWLKSSAIGKGYATYSVDILKKYAMNVLNAKRLEIRVSGANFKSQQVAKRCNFKHEATLKNERTNPDGSIDDTFIFSITSN